MGLILVIAIIVGAVIYFKCKADNDTGTTVETDDVVNRIRESTLTKYLQAFLLEQYGKMDSDEVNKLRQLAAGGGRAGYLMEVESKGIIFKLINRKGETLDKWAITFDALGYKDLPYAATGELKKILLQTLTGIPHLMVLDTGFFMYNQNREKQSW